MGLKNGIIGLALALYALALAGIVSTDAYSHAASKEARGVQALVHELAGTPTETAMLADAPQAVNR